MKSLTVICLATTTMLFTGCQSFQFVESPIPVKNLPATTIVVQSGTP